MSISTISSNALFTNSLSSIGGTSAVTNDASSGTGAVSGQRHHHRGGGEQFLQAVQQALGQAGIGLPAQSSSGGTDQDGDNDGSGSTSGSQTIGQDIHKLTHDLFSALRQVQGQNQNIGGTDSDGDNDGSSAAGVKSGYTSLDSALQGLIQQLGSGSTTANGPLSALQSDFQNLLKDAQNQAGAAATGSVSSTSQAPTLQSFLQAVLTGLGGQSTNSAALGGAVSVTS